MMMAMRRSICRPFRTISLSSFSTEATSMVYHKHGPPDEVLRLNKVTVPRLSKSDILVKMLAAPINPSDINRIEGVYSMSPPPPAVAGGEGVGEVIDVGPEVQTLKVGDWVIPAYSGLGTWSTHIWKEEQAWCQVPHDVPIEYLATISVNPCTAFRMLQDFVSLEAGDVVVQNGATSMVGQCVIQLAHAQGCRTINIVRQRPGIEKAKEDLLSLGATEVILESDLDLSAAKTFLDGHEPKLGLNCVGGSAATAVLKLIGKHGIMVTYGGMSKRPVTVSTSSLIFKDVQLRGFWLQNWIHTHKHQHFVSMTNHLLSLVKKGNLRYGTEKIPFDDFNSALHKSMGKEGSIQKQVLVF